MQLLRDIALFVEVATTRSFTLAARNLEMPASTLSRRISGLEKALGLTLLNRTTRQVTLTDTGVAYFDRCAHLVAEARTAHEQLRETAQVARGTLRVSCTQDFASLYLTPLLVAFTRRHPQVDVELLLSPDPADLLVEKIDLAIRIGRLPDSSLFARKVATLQLGMYASPGYFAVAGEPTRPDDLTRHMCLRIRATQQWSTWQLSNPALGQVDLPVQVTGRFAITSISLIKEFALLGGGIGVMDRRLARDDVESGRLREVLPGWCLPSVPVHVLTASKHVPARVRLFGDLLTAHFAGLPIEAS